MCMYSVYVHSITCAVLYVCMSLYLLITQYTHTNTTNTHTMHTAHTTHTVLTHYASVVIVSVLQWVSTCTKLMSRY